MRIVRRPRAALGGELYAALFALAIRLVEGPFARKYGGDARHEPQHRAQPLAVAVWQDRHQPRGRARAHVDGLAGAQARRRARRRDVRSSIPVAHAVSFLCLCG